MGELKITDLIDKGQIEELQKLEEQLASLKDTYENVAKELAKSLKMNIETPKDLDKLYEIYRAQADRANKVTQEMNTTLGMQKKALQEVATELQRKIAQDGLSAKELKELSDAAAKNAVAMDKVAKAEASMARANKAAASSVRNANISEEERNKIIKEAIELTNKQVHSIQEANEVNKKLRQAVRLVRDTDVDFEKVIGRLNSTIGINTDYVRRNSDRYVQQKMTIGDYKEQVKAAIIELQNGNRSMKNMGIVAKGLGGILRTSVAGGFNEVKMGVGNMIKGFVGAQAVIGGIQSLGGKLREGWQSIVSFQTETSKLAAILGTTSKGIKELMSDAKKLGATTKYTASQATALQIELAKLGFTRQEILESTEYVLKFAQATGSELADAAALAGASLRMFGADTKETERYVSAMAVATTKSALSFTYLQTAMPIVGPVAKAFNFTIEDTLALLGKLSDSGFDASMAATALRNIFLNLADSNGKLAKALGGPVKTLPELVAGMKKLRDMGVDLNTTLELTDKRSVAQFNTLMSNIDTLLPLRENITDVTQELSQMATTMSDNVAGAIAGLQSAWESLMLTFSSSTGPAKDAIDFLAQGIRNIANSFKPLEEQENDRVQQAIKNKLELYKMSGGEKILIQSLTDAWEENKKAGMESKEAFKKASADRIADLEAERQKYTKLRDEEKMRYKSHTELYFSANALSKALKPGKYKQMSKERDMYFLGWTQAEAELAKVNEKIRAINSETSKFLSSDKGGKNTILSPEQLKELERQAKEKAKIQAELNDTNIALMEEGLEKEIAMISLAYNKKMAAVKGNSKEEQKIRENYAKMMEKDIAKKTVEYAEKAEKEKTEQAKKQADERLRVVGEEQAARIVISNTNMSKEMDSLAEQYKNGEISLEEYEKKKSDISKKYGLEQLQIAIEYAKMMSEIPGLSEDDKLKMKQKIAEQEVKLSNMVRDNEVEDAKERAEAHKKYVEEVNDAMDLMNDVARDALGQTADLFKGLQDIIKDVAEDGKLSFETLANAAIEIMSGINNIVQQSFQNRIDKIEKEQEANEEAKEKEIERYEEMAEAGAISEEEAEARKRAAEDQTAAKNKELEKKKIDLKRKQAIWDKATNIAQAGMATALAVTKALPNIVLASIVGALGAIQIATIAATPLPAYAEGTKNGKHPGGKAVVGDGGKKELVVFNGMAWLTPDKPVVVELPKGAEVFPDASEFARPDWTPTNMELRPTKDGGFVVVNDYVRLEHKLDETNAILMKSMRYQRKMNAAREFEIYKRLKL